MAGIRGYDALYKKVLTAKASAFLRRWLLVALLKGAFIGLPAGKTLKLGLAVCGTGETQTGLFTPAACKLRC